MPNDHFTAPRNKSRPNVTAPTASAKLPSSLERFAADAAVPSDGREAYEAFDNKVRPVCLEVCCHRTGLSYSIPYAHLGAVVFRFRKGDELLFTGAGLSVKIKGRNLGGIYRALQLHVCGLIEDYDPEYAIQPQPADPNAALVETIVVTVPSAIQEPPKDK